MDEPRVASIHVGKIAPLGPGSVPSGFVKHAVPGAVNVTPLGIVGVPEDIAYLNLCLASDESSYITGINIVADGGITMRGS